MISSDVLNAVNTAVQSIASSPIHLNWWTEFSFWQDFGAFLRTGSKFVHSYRSGKFEKGIGGIGNCGGLYWNLQYKYLNLNFRR